MNCEKALTPARIRQANGCRTDSAQATITPTAAGVDKPTQPAQPKEAGLDSQAVQVEIYVAEHCVICEYAYEVADSIRTDFPDVDLRIIDLSQTSEAIPDAVFATPTYLLNGRLWSLGNPSPQDVQERLSAALNDAALTSRGTTRTNGQGEKLNE